MNQGLTDYLNEHLPVGITSEMAYKQVIYYIYWSILIFDHDIKSLMENNTMGRRNTWSGPMTISDLTTHFVKQYLGDI
jgi:hypothetical protein